MRRTPEAAPTVDRPDPGVLEVSQLRFRYPGQGFVMTVPHLALGPGAALRLHGPSGSGKTTLLRLLAGLLRPESGDILYPGLPPSAGGGLSSSQRLRHLGLVFQHFALLDYLTAEENCLLPGRFIQSTAAELQHLRERAGRMASQLEMETHWLRPVRQLSQGEQQRVAVIRALLHEPRLVLADEPTSALDGRRRDLVVDLMLSELQRSRAALIFVTHDPDLTTRFEEHLDLATLQSHDI